MRKIQTFVLRLLKNTDEPHKLRGVIQPIDDDEEYPFSDEQSLLTLLRQMSDAHSIPGGNYSG